MPDLEPKTSDGVRRQREAGIRRDHRLAKKAEIDSGRGGHLSARSRSARSTTDAVGASYAV